MEIKEMVYDSLLNTLHEDYRLPWVKPVFVEGHRCYEEYENAQEVYDRLRIRLGIEDEDKDIEEMIDALLAHGKILAEEMFDYGRIYEHMLYTKESGKY